MEITANITTIINIALTETEARLALVDPREMQTQLRQALAPLAAARQTRQSVSLGKARRSPKGPAQPAATKPSSAGKERTPCSICKKPLRPSSVGYHMKHNHPDAARAATG